MDSFAADALELEVLVARAARTGHLDVAELAETYARLHPTGHRDIDNPRKVDIAAMAKALELLPPELVAARRLLVVPRLDVFPHAPIESAAGLRAGVLSDGTLLIEAPLGLVSLVHLAAALCVLYCELDKADALLPPLFRPPEHFTEEPEDVAFEADAPFGADTPFEADARFNDEHDDPAHSDVTVEDAASWTRTPGPIDDEATIATGVQVAEHGAANGDPVERDPIAASDEPTLEETPATANEDALNYLAFAFGSDPETLAGANARTGGALLELLLQRAELPDVDIHADLAPGVLTRSAYERGQRIVAGIAESGLLGRPIHVWIGSSVISDCLSPYPRELRPHLERWAATSPSALGEDLGDPTTALGEDVIYAIAHDFLGTDRRLAKERAEAERTVGIHRCRVDPVDYELIDLGRIDASVCDARIAHWSAATPAPVLLRIPAELGDTRGGRLRAILDGIGPSIASITVVLEGSVLSARPGTVLLPHLMVRWAGESKLSLPTAPSVDGEALELYADAAVQRGAVLSAPSVALVSASRVADLRRQLNVAAVEVGGDGVLSAINDALWTGQLAPTTRASWLLVGMQRTRTGRPTVQSLAGLSAVAIAHLRAGSGDGAPEPRRRDPDPPPPEPEPERKPVRPSPRAIRIKA